MKCDAAAVALDHVVFTGNVLADEARGVAPLPLSRVGVDCGCMEERRDR